MIELLEAASKFLLLIWVIYLIISDRGFKKDIKKLKKNEQATWNNLKILNNKLDKLLKDE